jgi:hypothetical protein
MLMTFLAMVVLLIALAFPFGSTYITELMFRSNLPAAIANRLCHWLGLAYPCRPSEFELIEQVEAVLFVLMPAPVVFRELIR